MWDAESVKDEFKAWGRYMSQSVNGYASINTLGRIKEEGEGACIRSVPDYLPAKGCPKRLAWIHRVWINEMDEEQSRIVFTAFAVNAPVHKKAKVLKMSERTYHYKLAAAINFTIGYAP
jgi:hypothetical protein